MKSGDNRKIFITKKSNLAWSDEDDGNERNNHDAYDDDSLSDYTSNDNNSNHSKRPHLPEKAKQIRKISLTSSPKWAKN